MTLSFGLSSSSGQFANPETGIRASVGSQGVSVVWHTPFFGATQPYPRYEALRKIVESIIHVCAEQGIGDDYYNNANLAYVNYVSTGGVQDLSTIRRFISADFIPPITLSGSILFDLNYSYRIQDETDWDWRIQIEPGNGIEEPGEQRGFLLITSGGATVAHHKDVLHTIDVVHDRMQTRFSSAITEEAKELWHLQSR